MQGSEKCESAWIKAQATHKHCPPPHTFWLGRPCWPNNNTRPTTTPDPGTHPGHTHLFFCDQVLRQMHICKGSLSKTLKHLILAHACDLTTSLSHDGGGGKERSRESRFFSQATTNMGWWCDWVLMVMVFFCVWWCVWCVCGVVFVGMCVGMELLLSFFGQIKERQVIMKKTTPHKQQKKKEEKKMDKKEKKMNKKCADKMSIFIARPNISLFPLRNTNWRTRCCQVWTSSSTVICEMRACTNYRIQPFDTYILYINIKYDSRTHKKHKKFTGMISYWH